MGQVILRNASTDDILADLATTRARAADRGSPWSDQADRYLADVADLATRAGVERDLAEAAWDTARRTVDRLIAANRLRISAMHDELWNALGRPGSDVRFAMVFPDGCGTGTEGPLADQPRRLELIADLLGKHLHPRLPAARCDAFAAEIRAMMAALRPAIDALDTARLHKAHYGVLRGTLARAGQVQLVQLKRCLRGMEFRETEIHQVIPDRSGSSRSPARVAATVPVLPELPTQAPVTVPPVTSAPPALSVVPDPDVDAGIPEAPPASSDTEAA